MSREACPFDLRPDPPMLVTAAAPDPGWRETGGISSGCRGWGWPDRGAAPVYILRGLAEAVVRRRR